MNLGLIGKSLKHSFSKHYFEQKFMHGNYGHCSYQNFELPEINEEILNGIIEQNALSGFNVTIPYKEQIVPFIHQLTPEAKEIGAVNTVLIEPHKNNHKYYLSGYNTDYIGFLKSIRPFLTYQHQKALILGTGGAAKSIHYALKSLGCECWFVSRDKKENILQHFVYSELNETIIKHFKLIVNTTPLGTFPQVEDFPPIPFQYIGKEHLLFDLIYNPETTVFLEYGRKQGAAIINGLSMLQFQAEEAWKIWNQKKGNSD
ncbi:MAG: shikimate dehydrogenase [Bacteroidia bacterium]|nr:shikimate dehydrogenase [Bacteroidia bacterium]MCZ2249809.1 shikimate dehydrogenase [Bacteroidia bacterium]